MKNATTTMLARGSLQPRLPDAALAEQNHPHHHHQCRASIIPIIYRYQVPAIPGTARALWPPTLGQQFAASNADPAVPAPAPPRSPRGSRIGQRPGGGCGAGGAGAGSAKRCTDAAVCGRWLPGAPSSRACPRLPRSAARGGGANQDGARPAGQQHHAGTARARGRHGRADRPRRCGGPLRQTARALARKKRCPLSRLTVSLRPTPQPCNRSSAAATP